MRWLVSLLFISLLSQFVDLPLSRLFFEKGAFLQKEWMDSLYRYGILPGWVLILAALLLLFRKGGRRAGLYLLLVLGLGSGLISHLLLKEGWPRPRPKQVVEFGGQLPFHPLLYPYKGESTCRSLPSGHATMGYLFFALIPIGKKEGRPLLVYLGLGGGLFLGGLLSYIRIAQGGHFLSDTLVSLWVMAATTSLLSPLLGAYEESHTQAA